MGSDQGIDTSKCKYGYFDSENREYVITSPYTPKPWINYLGGVGDLDAFVSNRAGGTVWYKQPHTGRLTRYQYMAVPDDHPGFYLYIRHTDGTVWNPSASPTFTRLDKYECRHGMYYTKFDSEKNGLRAQVKYFIPAEDPVMLWDVTFTNNSQEEMVFSAYPYLDFSMRDIAKDVMYYHFCGNQMTASYCDEYNALMLDYFAFEAHHPGFTLFNASKKFTNYDMRRDTFIGRCRSEANPEALDSGVLANSEVPGAGFHICGAFKLNFKLAPGASERVVIKLAANRKLEDAGALLKKYDDFAVADAAAANFENWWDSILEKNQVYTPEKGLNDMLNTWFPKNIKTTMRCGRSISHRHTGSGTSKTFRDTMQDIMAGSLFFPEETKENILLLMHSIRENGQIVTNIDPVSLKCSNPEHIRCDAIVWGIFTIAKYIAETGDKEFLNTPVADYEGKESTVIDLLLRAMRFTGSNTGKHGLPKLFNCDWNDSLVIISAILSDGESTMVAMQYIVAAKMLIKMLDERYADDIAFLNQKIEDFTKALDSDEVWDGNWYRRLLFPAEKMGSSENEEGSIFLNAQTWASLAGTLDPEHIEKAMDSVYNQLHTRYGIQLFYPPFTKLMDGTRYCGNAPGAGENSGLFYHANTWAVIAEAQRGNSKRAWEYFRNIRPDFRTAKDADLYEREPYAFASWVYGPINGNCGKAALTHLTGGAAWIYRAATEYLLGIRPEADGLRIVPCIPAEWSGYCVDRILSGALYHIEVQNPEHKTGPDVKIVVDGTPIEGNLIPRAPKGTKVKVDVTII